MSKLALAIGALVMAGGAMAQSGNKTASADAGAIVIAPLTITKAGDLNFGNVVASNAAGTVVLIPGGTRTANAGATFSAAFPGTITAAKFDLTGEGVYTYAITLPATATLTSGSDTVIVNTFTVGAGVAGSVTGTVGTLAAGVGNLNVGATLNVVADQAPGTYEGDFPVTVAYN